MPNPPSASPPEHPAEVVSLEGVDVTIDGVGVLHSLDLVIRSGERWVIVGPNGSGKTTLLRVLSGWQRVSAGTARILGETLGRTDMRALRTHIGYTSQSLSDLLRPTMTPHEVVLAAPNGALETWWHRYGDAAHADASAQLRTFGIDEATEHRSMRTLSSGERQRVLLARAFSGRPQLITLDEPTAGLDVGGREDLVTRLARAADSTEAPLVLVTHHLEEIPPVFDHVVLVSGGRIVAAGPTSDLLTSESLSALYGTALDVACRDGRWSAVAASGR